MVSERIVLRLGPQNIIKVSVIDSRLKIVLILTVTLIFTRTKLFSASLTWLLISKCNNLLY